jgi:antitoxin (DNA-binding transcriptional repressor) of toxin-antitoxin stability system
MTKAITATEAARNFSDLLNRVHYRGETFDIVRGGEVIARITGTTERRRATVQDLIAALESAGEPDASFADDLERIQADQPALPGDPWAT